MGVRLSDGTALHPAFPGERPTCADRTVGVRLAAVRRVSRLYLHPMSDEFGTTDFHVERPPTLISNRVTRRHSRPEAGVVYVLLNPAMPGLVKIGRTASTSEQRARKLHTTGVPAEFIVLWDEPVVDAKRVEQRAHSVLDAWRDSKRREFFRVSPKHAIRTVIDCSTGYRLSIGRQRSRDILPELRARFGEEVWPELVEAWAQVSRGGIEFVATFAPRGMQLLKLGQLALRDEPAFSPLDPPESSADVLLDLSDQTLRRMLGSTLLK